MTRLAPVLVIGIGNPSRGDDAIGPLAIERLAALALSGIELVTDFQLQVEHALDIAGRRAVVFVDASVSASAPFELDVVRPQADASATTHALSPAAVLATCERLAIAVPDARVLAVRGYAFELGAPLTPAAAQNLDAAVDMLAARLADRVLTSTG